jgi:hypothetical protein
MWGDKMDDNIIISYQKKETTPESNKMIIRKIMISLMIGLLNFILFGESFFLILSEPLLFIIILIVLVVQLFLITTISTICEMKMNQISFVQVIVTILLQVVIPTTIMIPFDHLYGLMILTCFCNAVVFTVIDYIVRIVSKKRKQKEI